jgi:hypothetical protein
MCSSICGLISILYVCVPIGNPVPLKTLPNREPIAQTSGGEEISASPRFKNNSRLSEGSTLCSQPAYLFVSFTLDKHKPPVHRAHSTRAAHL